MRSYCEKVLIYKKFMTTKFISFLAKQDVRFQTFILIRHVTKVVGHPLS